MAEPRDVIADLPPTSIGVPTSPRRLALVGVVLALELTALLLTGCTTSPLVPLVLVPPFFGALAWSSERAVRVWIGGTIAIFVVAAIVDLAGPPTPIPTMPLALATGASIVVAFVGARALRRRLDLAEARARAANQEAIAATAAHHAHQLATAATFAHELKNPLTAMQGLATLLRRRASKEPELEGELDGLVADVHTMAAAVTELLDFSRAIHPGSLKRVAVRALVDGACREVGVTPREVHVADELVVVVEPRKLDRILRAMLQVGQVAPLVVSARDDGARVVIRVAALAHVVGASASMAVAAALAAQQGGALAVVGAPFEATLELGRIEVATPGLLAPAVS